MELIDFQIIEQLESKLSMATRQLREQREVFEAAINDLYHNPNFKAQWIIKFDKVTNEPEQV